MKLKINKASDLSSISVLPPRRTGETSQASQFRSQSQHSFSQGVSQSQLSQISLDENLAGDQRISSHDNSSKRFSLPASISTREESQVQLSRVSNNALPRWNRNSVPDNRYQIIDELEHKFRHVEGSVNRMSMILDSVQNDIIQINRAVKEITLETEGIRQKMLLFDGTMQQILKGEEDIKALVDKNLQSMHDQQIKNSNANKLNEMSSVISAMPDQIQASLVKLNKEYFSLFTKELEVTRHAIETNVNKHRVSIQPPVNHACLNSSQIPLAISKAPDAHLGGFNKGFPVSKVENDVVKTLQPKLTGSNRAVTLKQELIPIRQKEQGFCIDIDSDEESAGDPPCFIVKKDTGSCWMKEGMEESLRILKRARKRRRRQMNSIIKV